MTDRPEQTHESAAQPAYLRSAADEPTDGAPHEAPDRCPAAVCQPSLRPYKRLPDIDYPFHDKVIVVTHRRRICLGRKKINFSTVFAGQAVGIKEVHDIWLVSLMDYVPGYFDLDTRVLEPLDTPSARGCHPRSRYIL